MHSAIHLPPTLPHTHLYILSYTQKMHCHPPLWQLLSDFGDLSNGIFVMSWTLLRLKVILRQESEHNTNFSLASVFGLESIINMPTVPTSAASDWATLVLTLQTMMNVKCLTFPLLVSFPLSVSSQSLIHHSRHRPPYGESPRGQRGNEVEWTGNGETRMAEFPAAGEANKATFWSAQCLTKGRFDSSGFLVELERTVFTTSTILKHGRRTKW